MPIFQSCWSIKACFCYLLQQVLLQTQLHPPRTRDPSIIGFQKCNLRTTCFVAFPSRIENCQAGCLPRPPKVYLKAQPYYNFLQARRCNSTFSSANFKFCTFSAIKGSSASTGRVATSIVAIIEGSMYPLKSTILLMTSSVQYSMYSSSATASTNLPISPSQS